MQLADASGVELGNHFLVWAQGAVAPAIVGASAGGGGGGGGGGGCGRAAAPLP
jgi:hypothetical protein